MSLCVCVCVWYVWLYACAVWMHACIYIAIHLSVFLPTYLSICIVSSQLAAVSYPSLIRRVVWFSGVALLHETDVFQQGLGLPYWIQCWNYRHTQKHTVSILFSPNCFETLTSRNIHKCSMFSLIVDSCRRLDIHLYLWFTITILWKHFENQISLCWLLLTLITDWLTSLIDAQIRCSWNTETNNRIRFSLLFYTAEMDDIFMTRDIKRA